MIDITRNYFELFDISVSFQIDLSDLLKRYRALQSLVHPDRFSIDSQLEQRLSTQYSAYVNEGFATLKSPVLRAFYLLSLEGDGEDNKEEVTLSDTKFLMELMSLKETVQTLQMSEKSVFELEKLYNSVKKRMKLYSDEFEEGWILMKNDSSKNRNKIHNVRQSAEKMQFINKILLDLRQIEIDWLDS